jgi:hypothetical protein
MHRHHCVPIQGKTIHRIPEASAPSRIGADHADTDSPNYRDRAYAPERAPCGSV